MKKNFLIKSGVHMKRILTIIVIAVLTLSVKGQIISQYIETSSGTTPKGIEIWNNTASTIDFATTNLVVQQGTNGGAPANVVTVSSGTLSSGAVLVIGTAADVSGSGTGFKDFVETNGATFITYSFSFNGDDALVIKLNGVTTDVFGTPGVDPGTAWTGNGVSTANQNISINDGINTGDLDGWTDPSTRFSTTTTDNALTGFGIAPSTSTLPVQLNSFTAGLYENKIKLNWSTATEVNNYGFEIERQILKQVQNDSNGWEKIGFVQGHGNSNSPKDYSFIDQEKVAERSRSYRLKQLDFDGSFHYSDVVSVNNALAKSFKLFAPYPNPFNPNTTIKFSIPAASNVSLKIYDIIGNEIANLVNGRKDAGEYEVDFNAKNLPSGIYFSTLRSNGNTQTQKLILMK